MFPALGCIALLLTAAEGPSYEALVEEAQAARDAGDLTRSLELLRRAFEKEPTPGLRHNIGRLLEELGRYREAIDEYGAVTGHASADPALKKRDEAAIARLAPKLRDAWLEVRGGAAHGGALLDGAPLSAAALAGEELRASPGVHVIEVPLAGGREVVLVRLDAPSGVRTTVALDALTRAERTAVIELGGAPAPITRVAIDGYGLRAAEQLEAVRVAPGAHRLRVELSRGPGLDTRIDLRAGERFAARDWFPAIPEEGGETELGPILTGAGGVLAVAGGAILLAVARAGRARIEDAERNAAGHVTGITLAEADRIESRSALQAGTGVALAGAGTAALAGALIWWLRD